MNSAATGLAKPITTVGEPRLEAHVELQRSSATDLRLHAVFEYRAGSKDADHVLKVPELKGEQPGRCDRLWEQTCFEVFLLPEGGSAYWEINFAPHGDWNMYAFDSYRQGMRPETRVTSATLKQLHEQLDLGRSGSADVITRCTFSLDLSAVAQLSSAVRDGRLRCGITAVIESTRREKTYWALAHAGDKPDFHRPESFVLRLPALTPRGEVK